MPENVAWPDRWQPDAIAALEPYVDSDYLVEIWVGDPATSLSGTLIGGYLYIDDDGQLRIIYDRSGRPGAYPWRVLMGPVLRVKARTPGKRRTTIYENPDWVRNGAP